MSETVKAVGIDVAAGTVAAFLFRKHHWLVAFVAAFAAAGIAQTVYKKAKGA